MNDTVRVTKAEALKHFDGNQAALGRALGVSRQAIDKVPDDGDLPERLALKFRFVVKPKHRPGKREAA